jgi:peptidase E
VPAAVPTILATSGGVRRGRRIALELGPLIHYGCELAGVSGRPPKVCFVGTALGDQEHWSAWFYEAGRSAGIEIRVLSLFPMPNVEDFDETLQSSDFVFVGGGSVANLLALWRLHGLDQALERAWSLGVVLGGVSAGSICWHVGGTTDSFGPTLRPVTNGLGWLPHANGVHYDSEAQRRPLLHQLVADGTLPSAYATDDGVGLVYRGTELAEVVTEVPGKAAYRVWAEGGVAHEERLEPRVLPGA